jgi:hypothetical protein
MTRAVIEKQKHLLPIPGGPDSKAAFHGPLGFEKAFPTLSSLLKFASHVESQLVNLRTDSAFPKMSRVVTGLYLSTQSVFASDGEDWTGAEGVAAGF